MILVWKDARSFQRHLEAMGRFRRSHAGAGGLTRSFRDMPALFDVDPADNPGRPAAPVFAAVRGRPTVVPIWEIDLPGGSQN
jgi:hypothetical protein